MQKLSRIFNRKKTEPIYLIVPGFIGNYSEGFVKKLYDFLVKNNYSVQGITFRGHENNETGLASLSEMVSHISSEYLLLRKKYPQRSIIILAHSQGCAVSLRAAFCFNKETSLILFSPAIYLDKIILPRIGETEMRMIEAGTPVNCKVSKEKFRMIDINWVLSYRNFSVIDMLPKIKQKCLIVRPIADWIGKENVDILCQKLPRYSYLEMPGDHIFAEPKTAFRELVKIFFS
jgi:esterase/lipase